MNLKGKIEIICQADKFRDELEDDSEFLRRINLVYRDIQIAKYNNSEYYAGYINSFETVDEKSFRVHFGGAYSDDLGSVVISYDEKDQEEVNASIIEKFNIEREEYNRKREIERIREEKESRKQKEKMYHELAKELGYDK